jgi:oligopeptide/dipeptide ABC transporter, ATP-binding protein, C-terminal domain
MKKSEILQKETISIDVKPGEFLLIINRKKKLSDRNNISFENKNIIDIAIDNNKRINNSFMSLIKVYLTSLNPIRSIGKQCTELISKYTGLSLQESEFKLEEVLNKLLCPNTETLLKNLPRKLEAYEKQRLMFAIAFIVKPKLIVLDDTIFKMEPEIRLYILDQLKKLKEENKTSIILISKKLDVINEIIDNIAIMYKGTIVEYGKKDLVLTDPIHPYTRYIFTSKDGKDLVETTSEIVDYVKGINKLPLTGCSFCLKCNTASYDCVYMSPKIKNINNDRQVICSDSTKIA